jgi:hypothetical protein
MSISFGVSATQGSYQANHSAYRREDFCHNALAADANWLTLVV